MNYRETITKRADFDYLHKKQSGGFLQYLQPEALQEICDAPMSYAV